MAWRAWPAGTARPPARMPSRWRSIASWSSGSRASFAHARREARLAALLHDAPEYVIGDLISPFKAAVGIDYKDFELRLLAAIHIRFGLPPKTPHELEGIIKRADLIAAYFEATQLAGFDPKEARSFFGVPPKGMRTPRLTPLSVADAEALFLERFRKLAP